MLDGWGLIDDDSIASTYQNYHGTAVSGIIAALKDNNLGIASVAPDSQVVMYRAFDRNGSGDDSDIIQAILMADERGLKIINCSFGERFFNPVLYDVMAERPGMLFVCSAGNYGEDNDGLFPVYPGSFDLANVMCIAATNNKDELAGFSNYGENATDCAAPGVNTYTTSINLVGEASYVHANGTSFAAPAVAGIAALIRSQDPTLSAVQVKQRIIDTTDPVAALSGLVGTSGRVNAFRALGGREDADIALWARIGLSETVGKEFGSQPTEGQYQTLIATGPGSVGSSELETFLGLSAGDLNSLIGGNATEGSAIELEIEVDAGATIRIDWKFLTNEHAPGPHKDFCFLSIRGEPLSKLADTDSDVFPSPTVTFARETSQETFHHQFTTAGTYKVGIGVVDEGDTSVHSGLLVDNPVIQPAESAVA